MLSEHCNSLVASPRSLDLFCGIGGITIGFEASGIRSIGGVDYWQDAKRTFDHNHSPLRCMLSDMTKTSVGEIELFFGIRAKDIDIVAGGPPCQGFSSVGKMDPNDPRNTLWRHYCNIVSQIRPFYVVMENVEGMLKGRNANQASEIIDGFYTVGYNMKYKVLLAADYGVPQLRKRLIFLGWLRGLQEPKFPKRSVDEFVTVGDAIFDLPPLASRERKTAYSSEPTTTYQRNRRKSSCEIYNHEAANHPSYLVDILSHIPDGGNRKSIPDHLQPKSGFHNSYARLASHKPAIAITSNMRKPSSARATHPLQPRGLTVREGLRLQSFDDDFVVLGSRTSQYLQVGNAVPPLLSYAIGQEVLSAWRSNSKDQLLVARNQV
jgi:DNA (cytosine-5)-methyltransferase 1